MEPLRQCPDEAGQVGQCIAAQDALASPAERQRVKLIHRRVWQMVTEKLKGEVGDGEQRDGRDDGKAGHDRYSLYVVRRGVA